MRAELAGKVLENLNANELAVFVLAEAAPR